MSTELGAQAHPSPTKPGIHKAPNAEWVLLYRNGIPTLRIAAIAGVAASTVRYHLRIAARADPDIQAQHKIARGPVSQVTAGGLQNMADTISFYEKEGRLPSSGGHTARERALASWLLSRSRAAARGTLSPAYRDGLAVIPDWDRQPTRAEENAARWYRRLAELVHYRQNGNDWPLHRKAASEEERVLGSWLHGQRIKLRKGTLTKEHQGKLDAQLPGWREGRSHSHGAQKRTQHFGFAVAPVHGHKDSRRLDIHTH
jgi:Helicase associated domain